MPPLAGANAIAAPTISSETNRNARIGSSTLHLDLDDLADPDVADELHDDRGGDHLLPHALREEELHVIRVDEHQRDGERRRKRQQDIAGEAAVRGMHADLPQNLEALAYHVREVVENLGQVATCLTLNRHGGHEELHVEEGHALSHQVEHLAYRQAKILLLERLLELDADWYREFLGHHPHRGLERVTGAKRTRQQIERIGELLFETLHSRGPLVPQPEYRHDTAGERNHHGEDRTAQDNHADHTHENCRQQGEDHDGARRGVHARLLDELRQRGVGAAQRFVDRRERSQLLFGENRFRPGERVVCQGDFPEPAIEAAGGQPIWKLGQAVVAAHHEADYEHEDGDGSDH